LICTLKRNKQTRVSTNIFSSCFFNTQA
jgi:hypothetical protein